MKLKENWEISGKHEGMFLNELANITSDTEFKKVSSIDVSVFTVEKIPWIPNLFAIYKHAYENTHDKVVYPQGKDTALFHEGASQQEMRTALIRKLAENFFREGSIIFRTKEELEKVFHECTQEVIEMGVYITINDVAYPLSHKGLSSMSKWAQLGGDEMLRSSYERDANLMKALARLKKTLTFVTWKDRARGLAKIGFVHSGTYTPISQHTALKTILEACRNAGMAPMEMDAWKINQDRTECHCLFPESITDIGEDKFIPGITFITSDTGESTVKIRESYVINGVRRLGKEVTQMHRGRQDSSPIDDMVEKAKRDIYTQRLWLPNAMVDLLDITVSRADEGYEERDGKLKKILLETLRDIGVVKEASKKYEMQVREDIIRNLSYEGAPDITGYDIAMEILEYSSPKGDQYGDVVMRECAMKAPVSLISILRKHGYVPQEAKTA